LTVSDIGYEVLPTMVPQPWFVASQTSQNCHAKQPLIDQRLMIFTVVLSAAWIEPPQPNQEK